MLLDAREGVILAQQDEGEAFVVAQQDVVGRPEALDQLRFEQQRLGLGLVVTIVIDRVCADHALQPLRQPGDLRVVGDAVPQRPRLADVEHVAARILHPVDAGPDRQRLQHLADRRDARFEVRLLGAAHGVGRLLLVEALLRTWLVGTVGLAHPEEIGASRS